MKRKPENQDSFYSMLQTPFSATYNPTWPTYQENDHK